MPLTLADAIAPPGGGSKRNISGRSTSGRSTRPRTLHPPPRPHPSTARPSAKAVPDIGFLHSGFEKLGEHLDFNQYVTIVDRMNYISPVANEVAWHHSVECLLGIEITPRAKYIRTIFAELMRIHDHLLCCGAAALDLGGFTAFLYAFNEREKIYDISETASGQRFHPSFTRVGGLMHDVDDIWIAKVRDFVKSFPKAHADVVRLLNRNRIFIDRCRDIGVLSKEEAINLEAAAPSPAASGVVRDLPQGRALPGLRRTRQLLPGDLRHGRRLPDPLPGAHGRDAREHQDHRGGH